EAGYVYLAKPPLYKVRLNGRDVYIEKEAELEELLLRDKLERLDVRDRDGKQFKVTQARWQRFNIKLKQYEGWSSSLRAEYGHDAITFLEESQILDSGVTGADGVVKLLKKKDPEREPYETTLLDEYPVELVVRVVERATGSASTHRLRRDMFESQEYRSFAKVHSELLDLAGTPPFSVALAKSSREARSFEALRRAVRDVAGAGVKADRAKGLDERNADQALDRTTQPEERSRLQPGRPYRTCARVVGEVMGSFHPHGDSAIYDTLVRLAQDFAMRHPLVDGQGNFGSLDNDPPAAMRYTESRLARIATEMLRDIDADTVDFGANYYNTEREPLVLPARFPNLLVNGSAGIAVGMATNIPPHNLRETVDALM